MNIRQYTQIQDYLEEFLLFYIDECDLDEDRSIDSRVFAEEFVLLLMNNGFFTFPYSKETIDMIDQCKIEARVHADSYNNQG